MPSETPQFPPRPGETPPYGVAAWKGRAWRGCFNPEMPESTFYLERQRGLIDVAGGWVTTTHAEYLRRRKAFDEAKAAA